MNAKITPAAAGLLPVKHFHIKEVEIETLGLTITVEMLDEYEVQVTVQHTERKQVLIQAQATEGGRATSVAVVSGTTIYAADDGFEEIVK